MPPIERLTYELGKNSETRPVLGKDWESPTEVDTWTKAPTATLVLPTPAAAVDHFVVLRMLVRPGMAPRRVRVAVRGSVVAAFTVGDRVMGAGRIPAALLVGGPVLPVTLHLDDGPVALGSIALQPDVDVAAPLPGESDPADRLMMMRFESLGENCEFGLAQRAAGAEPLGLLRFASTNIRSLLAALDNGFAGGVGAPDKLVVEVSENGREYMVADRVYGLHYHAWVMTGEMPAEAVHRREVRRMPFLLRKLAEDLEAGQKIFVRKERGGEPDAVVYPLLPALRRWGPNTLLYVKLADADHPPGTVERREPGFLVGYIERFAPGENAHDFLADQWLALCRAAQALVWPGLFAARSGGAGLRASVAPVAAAAIGGTTAWKAAAGSDGGNRAEAIAPSDAEAPGGTTAPFDTGAPGGAIAPSDAEAPGGTIAPSDTGKPGKAAAGADGGNLREAVARVPALSLRQPRMALSSRLGARLQNGRRESGDRPDRSFSSLMHLEAPPFWARLFFFNDLAEPYRLDGAAIAATGAPEDAVTPVDPHGEDGGTVWRRLTFGHGPNGEPLDPADPAAGALVLPACTDPADPVRAVSDWVSLPGTARGDGGRGALVLVRSYSAGLQRYASFDGHADEATGILSGGYWTHGDATAPAWSGPWHRFDRAAACHGLQYIAAMPGATVVGIGDGVMQGIGSSGQVSGFGMRACVAVSRPDLPVSWFNEGHADHSSAQYARAGRWAIETLRPQVTLIQTWSANDPPTQAGAEAGLAHAVALAEATRRCGGVPVLVTPAPAPAGEDRGDAARRSVVERVRGHAGANTPVLDLDTIWGAGTSPETFRPAFDSGDHRHPNDAGCVAAAMRLADLLGALFGMA